MNSTGDLDFNPLCGKCSCKVLRPMQKTHGAIASSRSPSPSAKTYPGSDICLPTSDVLFTALQFHFLFC